MQWEQNDIITNGSDKRKILGVAGEIIFMSLQDNFVVASSSVSTQHELELIGYSLVPKEESWPSDGDCYYFVSTEGLVRDAFWRGFTMDFNRREFGNIFKTKQEAIEYAARVRELKNRKG